SRATGQPFLQLATSPPFALVRQLVGVPNAAASFASPFGPDLSFPQFPAYSPTTQRSILIVDQGYRPPVTQQFSLNIQTELGRDFLVDVGYVAAPATPQILAPSLNQALLASSSNPIRGQTTNTVANIAQRVPIQGFTAVGLNDIDSQASSWYHGLEASVTKRFGRGLQFLAAYTFARAYSTAGANTGAAGGGGSGQHKDPPGKHSLTGLYRAPPILFCHPLQTAQPARVQCVPGYLAWRLGAQRSNDTSVRPSFELIRHQCQQRLRDYERPRTACSGLFLQPTDDVRLGRQQAR